MARTAVKATYALDVATVEALERMARRWDVSKSEALRRAIHVAAATQTLGGDHAVAALGRLQRALALSPAKARAWGDEARAERRASFIRAAGKRRR